MMVQTITEAVLCIRHKAEWLAPCRSDRRLPMPSNMGVGNKYAFKNATTNTQNIHHLPNTSVKLALSSFAKHQRETSTGNEIILPKVFGTQLFLFSFLIILKKLGG